jgi:hypothetical protein
VIGCFPVTITGGKLTDGFWRETQQVESPAEEPIGKIQIEVLDGKQPITIEGTTDE